MRRPTCGHRRDDTAPVPQAHMPPITTSSVRLAAVSRDMNCTSISSYKKISGKAKRTVSPRRNWMALQWVLDAGAD